jgi:two-component system chemotaxis sensor kinase CheA
MGKEEYLELFITESREHLDNLNNSLVALEKDPSNIDFINEIFRSMHTLKGMAATMGFEKIETLTHKAEDILDDIRKDKLKPQPEIVDILFESLDLLEEMLEKISAGEGEGVDISSVLKKMEEYKAGKIKPKAEKAKAGPEKYVVTVQLHEKCQLKSVRAFIVVKTLKERGEVIKTTPPLEEMDKEDAGLEFKVLFSTETSKEDIVKSVQNLPEISRVEVVPEREALKEEVKAAPAKAKAGVKVTPTQSLRVSIERLDTMVNLVGELIINKAAIKEIIRKYELKELEAPMAIYDRLLGDLQYEVMQLRMVPMEQIFNRFPRIVRDIARKRGKEVDFTIEGKEIEVDRTILDEIDEPMIHLIRNSIDHGIEDPEEREKNGKPRMGRLTVKAIREKDHVEIYVEDDGRGINVEKIKEVAIKKKIITKEEASTLSEKEALNLIFRPGFSTAEKITDLSGRGVGMDVVKAKIEKIGGSVEIDSTIGVGTRVTLKLPLTMAIIQALLVGVNGEIYAIPLLNVDKIVDVKKKDIKTVKNQEVIKIYDEVIPLVRLEKYTEDESKDTYSVVIVEKGAKKVGLIVDKLISQQDIVIKPLGEMFSDVKGFSGATILGDGTVALIIDTATLVG